MLTLYTDSSPNGFKATIALEELGLPYTLKHVHINQGEHRQPDFLRLNPHGRIPVLTDDETGITLFESAAILLPGRENRPPAARRTARPLASHAMAHLPRRQRRPADRPTRPLRNLRRPQRPHRHRTLPPPHERSLRNAGPAPGQRPAFAGDEYSIADIAHFGWTHIARLIGFDFDAYPHLSDWHERIALRPAVQRGIMLPEPAIGA